MEHITYSIAICSHNPDLRLLHRLLYAINSLQGLHEAQSIVLVDNNSSPPLNKDGAVVSFLASTPSARYVVEEKQGLTYARLRAIRETDSDILIFLDDDNEPCANYLEHIRNAFYTYPNSGAWGPGRVSVEFVDRTPEEVKRYSNVFQKRDTPFGYACTPGEWNSFCPFGTGLAVRRIVLDSYANAYEQGRLTRSDRRGKSLSSAGDIQIVWQAFNLGYSAGVLPDLTCNHMINSSKANSNYIFRLSFWTASSYLPALSESFPQLIPMRTKKRGLLFILSFAFSKYCLTMILNLLAPKGRLGRTMAYARWLGNEHGRLTAWQDQASLTVLRIALFLRVA
ncbi:glycosyltransferase [Cyanobium sp. NIES-981]|uniref:glycosyltransferase n=1 Tax=Cyanobium sp. NIES-981 TaxID=1851505 RepID=UPI000B35DAA6